MMSIGILNKEMLVARKSWVSENIEYEIIRLSAVLTP